MIEAAIHIPSILGFVFCLKYTIVCILLVWAACAISSRLAQEEEEK